MRIENVNGRNLVCGHIFPLKELSVGQTWAPADRGNREVVIAEINGDDVTYTWNDPEPGAATKDWFSFQSRYCLVRK